MQRDEILSVVLGWRGITMRAVSGAILALFWAVAPPDSAAEPPPASQPVTGFPAPGTPEELLQHADVQKELKLNSQQLEAINQAMRTFGEKYQRDFDKIRNLGPQERRQKQAELVKTISQEIGNALTHVLEPRQAKRLEQIHLQRQGLQAFTDPKVEKALRLTGEQKMKLKTIRDDAAKEARALFGGRAQGNFQETLKQVEQIRGKALEKSVALLTAEQKQIWRDLTGEAFAVQAAPPLIRPP
jgi:hypothetical protein